MTTRSTTEHTTDAGGTPHTGARSGAAAPNSTALVGALLTGTGVALGAFGAHALESVLSVPMQAVFETAVRYQMYHGLGLLALGALPAFQNGRSRAAGLLLAGTLVFSGSLYLLSLTGIRWLGAVTPIGGLLMLAGWSLAAWSLWKGTPGRGQRGEHGGQKET